MNRLQLFISKSTAAGFATVVELNADDEGRRAVADMRDAVARVSYPDDRRTLFHAMTAVGTGHAIHVLRTIPPSRPNHLDATVYISSRLDIMADEIEAVLQAVAEVISRKSITQSDMDSLSRLFATTYDTLDRPLRVTPSHGSELAYVEYGGQSGLPLADVIAEGLASPEWSDFRAVMLLDGSLRLDGAEILTIDDNEPQHGEPQQPRDEEALLYSFTLPMTTPDGESVLEFEVETTTPLRRSPIAGYSTSGRLRAGADDVNELHPARQRHFKTLLLQLAWGLGGVILGIFIMAIVNLVEHRTPSGQPSVEQYINQPQSQK